MLHKNLRRISRFQCGNLNP